MNKVLLILSSFLLLTTGVAVKQTVEEATKPVTLNCGEF